MIHINKKEEVASLKLGMANEVRNDLKARKLKLEQEKQIRMQEHEESVQRVSEMEAMLNKVKEKRIGSRRSSESDATRRSNQYLNHLKELQEKAKSLIRDNLAIDNFPKPPPLEEKSITSISKTVDHIRVPVYVPSSILRKSNKQKPPLYNHMLKNGEVISVHLLTESMPTFDPLVLTEAKIPKNSLGRGKNILADISLDSHSRGRIMKSLSPIKHKKEYLEFSPPQGLTVIREHTPVEKLERYSFRECVVSESTSESQRSWVAKRMKIYAQRIKDACKPQISPKKQLEMELLKEKSRKERAIPTNRIKLKEISSMVH